LFYVKKLKVVFTTVIVSRDQKYVVIAIALKKAVASVDRVHPIPTAEKMCTHCTVVQTTASTAFAVRAVLGIVVALIRIVVNLENTVVTGAARQNRVFLFGVSW
jgi:hypothetical protein